MFSQLGPLKSRVKNTALFLLFRRFPAKLKQTFLGGHGPFPFRVVDDSWCHFSGMLFRSSRGMRQMCSDLSHRRTFFSHSNLTALDVLIALQQASYPNCSDMMIFLYLGAVCCPPPFHTSAPLGVKSQHSRAARCTC